MTDSGVGALLLALIIVAGMSAPLIAPYEPREQDRAGFYRPPTLPDEDCRLEWWPVDENGNRRLFGFQPCRVYLLGTDALGRDLLSRSLYGARWSLVTSILGVVFSIFFGTLVGCLAGFMGGWWDRALMRMTELVMALPALYLVLALRIVFPDDISPVQSAFVIGTSLAAVGWCSVSRLLRSRVITLRESDYVSAALAAGATGGRALFRHILPNALPFILLQAGIALPYFLLGEATLSYLGIGIPRPEPSLGNMLADAAYNYTSMMTYWWTLLVPAGALFLAVLAANLWTEGLRRSYFGRGGAESEGSAAAGWGSKQRRQRAS
jgi:peptide/nickel transport system permease protein